MKHIIDFSAPTVNSSLMLTIAVIGLFANLLGIFFLWKVSEESVSIGSAFLHIAGDALSSVGVIFAGAVILYTGWFIIDPLTSVLIGIIILISALRLVGESTDILPEGVPKHIDINLLVEKVKKSGEFATSTMCISGRPSPVYALRGRVLIDDQMISEGSEILNAGMICYIESLELVIPLFSLNAKNAKLPFATFKGLPLSLHRFCRGQRKHLYLGTLYPTLYSAI